MTAYGPDFEARECRGEYDDVTPTGLRRLIDNVRQLAAKKAPRLNRHATALDARRLRLVVSLLSPSKLTRFVRGWHSVRACGATYLSSVFLEHTHESGRWLTESTDQWPSGRARFDMQPTRQKLMTKSGAASCRGPMELLDTRTFPAVSRDDSQGLVDLHVHKTVPGKVSDTRPHRSPPEKHASANTECIVGRRDCRGQRGAVRRRPPLRRVE